MTARILCLVVAVGCRSVGAPMATAPTPAALTTPFPGVLNLIGPYDDTGRGEEVKAYYAGDPRWGPVSSRMVEDKELVKMPGGHVSVDAGTSSRVWERTSTNVVLVSLRKYESECLMKLFVAIQRVYQNPTSSPDAWEMALTSLIPNTGSGDAVPISCDQFDKLPNDPSIAENNAREDRVF